MSRLTPSPAKPRTGWVGGPSYVSRRARIHVRPPQITSFPTHTNTFTTFRKKTNTFVFFTYGVTLCCGVLGGGGLWPPLPPRPQPPEKRNNTRNTYSNTPNYTNNIVSNPHKHVHNFSKQTKQFDFSRLVAHSILWCAGGGRGAVAPPPPRPHPEKRNNTRNTYSNTPNYTNNIVSNPHKHFHNFSKKTKNFDFSRLVAHSILWCAGGRGAVAPPPPPPQKKTQQHPKHILKHSLLH